MRRLLIALAFIPLPAGAWTHASDQRIAQISARLAPPDLQLVIHRYEKDFARGLQLALVDKGPIHGTNLRQSIERETRTIVVMIRGNQPMNVVVEHLGILAHLVGDANNPMYVPSAVDLQSSSGDFETFLKGPPKGRTRRVVYISWLPVNAMIFLRPRGFFLHRRTTTTSAQRPPICRI